MAKIKKISIWKNLTQFLNRKNKTDDDTTLYFIEAKTVIESNTNSTLPWYRIYSDGFCMQGGTNSTSTVTLPKPFKSTTYHVLITPIGSNNSFSYTGNTKSSFNVSGVNTYSWLAFGYVDT